MKTKTSILALTKAFFILLVMCCFSCSNDKNNDNISINRLTDGQKYRIEVIDSCEYIGHYSGYGYYLTHKGNCKFCAKRSLK